MTINQVVSIDDELASQYSDSWGSEDDADSYADNDFSEALSGVGMQWREVEEDRRLSDFRSLQLESEADDGLDREGQYERFRAIVKSGSGSFCEDALSSFGLGLCVSVALESPRLEKHRELLTEVLGQLRRGERININAMAKRRDVPVTTLQAQWARAMLLMRQELQKLGPIQEWCDDHHVVH